MLRRYLSFALVFAVGTVVGAAATGPFAPAAAGPGTDRPDRVMVSQPTASGVRETKLMTVRRAVVNRGDKIEYHGTSDAALAPDEWLITVGGSQYIVSP